MNHHKTIFIKTNQINVLNKRIETLDHTYTNDSISIPIPFRDLVKCYYDDAATIEEYWKMANIAAYKYLFEHEDDLKLIIAISAFKQLINAIKRKKVNNPIAYYYAILINKYREVFHEKLDDLSSGIPVEHHEGIFY